MQQIVFASNNKNKLNEVRSILGTSFNILSLEDIDCHDEIPETADTFAGNAAIKSTYVHEKYKLNCFADDSGLVIEALNGAPGVLSARYAGEPSNSKNNMLKVLQEMSHAENRKAYFIAVISLIMDGEHYLFEGRVNGVIATTEQGDRGFGYDPIFIPDSYEQSFATLPPEVKNSISHRAIALKKLTDMLLAKDNKSNLSSNL